MVRKVNLTAVALALVAGAITTGAAEARISLNSIKLNRISLNGIAANGGARVDQKTTAPDARGAVVARRTPGEGSVSSVLRVELPPK